MGDYGLKHRAGMLDVMKRYILLTHSHTDCGTAQGLAIL